MNVTYEQLPHEAAWRAASGWSHDPDGVADRDVSAYARYCDEVIAEFEGYETDDNRDELTADIQRYLDGYRTRKLALLAADARHVSAFIVGPSNYPTRTMEKRMETIRRRSDELTEYTEKVLSKLRGKYNGHCVAPVLTGDADATERLKAQLDKAIALQEIMKAANAIIRKRLTDDAKIAALVALDGISEEKARELLTPDCFGGVGFQSFTLTNNNANIRRLKERLAGVAQLQAAAPAEVSADGLTITEDANDNRIRIEFAGRRGHPANDWLKHHGWHWSPRGACWQRQITANARASAREFVSEWGGKL